MGSHGKAARWFPSLSGHHHHHHHTRSSSSSSSPAAVQNQNPNPATSPGRQSVEFPQEFVCPISGRLMADPVIIVAGVTYERNCIQVCKDLRVVPPGAKDVTAADLLIPNMALRAAIFNWCDSRGLDHPQSVDLPTARLFVRDLPSSHSAPALRSMSPADSSPSPPVFPHSRSISSSSSSSSYFTAVASSQPLNASAATTAAPATSSSPDMPSPDSPFPIVREILTGLKAPQASDQEAALLFLRSSSRSDSGEQRAALCDERILAALRPMILSRSTSLCLHAVASVVNLSLHPPNRVRIVRAGLVPPLVEVLKSNVAAAQDHAAAAMFSLSVDEDNKAAIGVLGALPPLLQILCKTQAEERTRRDAGMALYHLSAASTNVSKLLKLGAVKSLLGLAGEAGDGASDLAPMILCYLAASREGREAMIEAGGVPALTQILRAVPPWPSPEEELKREYCVRTLYAMSKAKMRFRGIALAAGLEEVLAALDQEEGAAATEEDGPKHRRFREMVKRTLRATRGAGAAGDGAGEEDDGGSGSWGSGESSVAGGFVGNYSEPILRMQSPSVNAKGAYTTRF